MNLNSSNRLVRTRMLGGVAGAEPNGSPLCRYVFFLSDLKLITSVELCDRCYRTFDSV